jgi:hypothetical protein
MDIRTSGGNTAKTVMAARVALVANKKTVITIMVSPWMANWASPSWSSCWRFSMSLVMRLMTTPAFSSVKKSRDSRWRCRNTVMRRSFMTHEARRPVTRACPHCAVPETAIDTRYRTAIRTTTPKS